MHFAQTATSSRSVFKGIIHGTGVYTGALFAQRMAGCVMLPIVTRALTPADYGVSSVLEQVGIVLSLLLGSRIRLELRLFLFQSRVGRCTP